jgi:hypothetical protein
MYRWAEIARREPLWATTGAGARGSSRRVDRGDFEGVLGVADAFPHLVSRLARACNDHENDATTVRSDRGSIGATHARVSTTG